MLDNWIYLRGGWFDGWRRDGFPTIYAAMPTAVTADVLETGLIFSAVILTFSLLIIVPGFRNWEKLTYLLRILVAVFILASIMLCNFGQEWEVAELTTRTQYRAGLRRDIHAKIKVKIGLRCVNITLEGKPHVQQTFENGTIVETVNYNERFSWDSPGWVLGRAGFGPLAGRFNREFREAQRKGSPYPILWIAEYFTIDGEGIRWGRHYLQAGFFSHIMLWTALPLWLLSLILYNMVLRYGAYFSILTGASMLIANIIFATYRNPNQLKIWFEDGPLVFHFGWCYKLCMVTGVICILIGIVVVLFDALAGEMLADFFGVDVTRDLEEFYMDSRELDVVTHGKKTVLVSSLSVTSSSSANASSTSGIEMRNPNEYRPGPLPAPSSDLHRGYRKKTVLGNMQRTQKKKQRPAPPPPPNTIKEVVEQDLEEDYDNSPARQEQF